MTATDSTPRIEVPSEAMQPDAINHLVLNVSDLDASHAFWSELIGFEEVVAINNQETGNALARFYRSKYGTGHHDLALFQITHPEEHKATLEEWAMISRQIGINHIAIKYHDRDEWLKQIAFLQSRGVKFHVRTEHGMTHSAYISDPDGYGIEILYEVPREYWEPNPAAAVIWGRRQPKEGPEALNDNQDYHLFSPDDPALPNMG